MCGTIIFSNLCLKGRPKDSTMAAEIQVDEYPGMEWNSKHQTADRKYNQQCFSECTSTNTVLICKTRVNLKICVPDYSYRRKEMKSQTITRYELIT